MKAKLLAIIMVLLFASPVLAKTIIDTMNGTGVALPYSQTYYGQSFIAPTDNILMKIIVPITAAPVATQIDVSIYKWQVWPPCDDGMPDGAALFTSTVAWTDRNIFLYLHDLNLALTAGGKYAIIFHPHVINNQFAYYVNDAYEPGGHLLLGDNTSPVMWNGSYDLSYYAEFTSIVTTPEPASMILIGLGIIGVAGLRKFNK